MSAVATAARVAVGLYRAARPALLLPGDEPGEVETARRPRAAASTPRRENRALITAQETPQKVFVVRRRVADEARGALGVGCELGLLSACRGLQGMGRLSQSCLHATVCSERAGRRSGLMSAAGMRLPCSVACRCDALAAHSLSYMRRSNLSVKQAEPTQGSRDKGN